MRGINTRTKMYISQPSQCFVSLVMYNPSNNWYQQGHQFHVICGSYGLPAIILCDVWVPLRFNDHEMRSRCSDFNLLSYIWSGSHSNPDVLFRFSAVHYWHFKVIFAQLPTMDEAFVILCGFQAGHTVQCRCSATNFFQILTTDTP